jgi:hypothetical protein
VRMSTLTRAVVILLAIVGAVFLVASLLAAVRPFDVHWKGHRFKCGSVLAPKDPRDLVSSRAQVPQLYKQANNRCQKRRKEHTHTAIKDLVAGVVPLLVVLMIPALGRRSRMARAHRRTRL